MVWPFRRRSADDSMDVDELLARANAASPPSLSSIADTDVTTELFRIPVGDVFVIQGRGLVATGTIESGTVSVGADVDVVRAGQVVATSTVTGVEIFREVRQSATAGETVGVLLRGLGREHVQGADLLVGR